MRFLFIRRAVFAITHPRFLFRRIIFGAKAAGSVGLKEMLRYHEKIEYVLEAGAYDGSDTELMLNLFPIKKMYVFEPVENSFKFLQSKFRREKKVNLYRSALSDFDGVSGINVSIDINSPFGAGSSSLLNPTFHRQLFPEIVFSEDLIENVKTSTLDKWAKLNKVQRLDLAWLDLQGMELRVILSGKELLSQTKMIYVEVSRKPLYRGACTYNQVHRALLSLGFKRKIERVGLFSGNVLYVKAS